MTKDQFKKRRISLKLSVSEMAYALGVTPRAVNYYESGGRKVPKPIIKLIEGMMR